MDDWEQYAFLPDPQIGQLIRPASVVASTWRAELDAMRRYGCLFMLTCHPFLSGRPSRVEALRTLLEYMVSTADVRVMTAEDVARRAHGDRGVEQRTLRPVSIDPAVYGLGQ